MTVDSTGPFKGEYVERNDFQAVRTGVAEDEARIRRWLLEVDEQEIVVSARNRVERV